MISFKSSSMMKSLAAAAATILAATACSTPYSPTPLATNFATDKQHKLQAAAHWTTIAHDVATRLSSRLPRSAPLFIVPPENPSAFERAFNAQLVTTLVDAGHLVTRVHEGALQVELDTQAVPFAADRKQYRHAGKATALGAGVWVLYDIVEHAPSGAGQAALLALGAADALAWSESEFAAGATPSMEIIVTASVTSATHYLARNTSVYYVADSDQRLYLKPLPQEVLRPVIKTFQVEGD